jgi:energy-coupling factor transporter ATP-binding protein EcfA2
MYLREVHIRNVRSLKEIQWEVPRTKAAGWHVIIGDNGSGKSTFLRSIALAMIGPWDAASLRLSWDDWLRKDQSEGSIELAVDHDDQFDQFRSKGAISSQSPLRFGVKLTSVWNKSFAQHTTDLAGFSKETHADERNFAHVDFVPPPAHVWGLAEGWFCAGYGPFRRLTGGDPEYARISRTLPKLARYLSIFDERVALTDCLEWLQTLKFQQLEAERGPESNQPGRELLPAIFNFINQPDFLPHQAQLKEITSTSVLFVDGNQLAIRIEDLSDGYRSILSMTFELIRQLVVSYGPSRVFDKDDPTKVICPGVVLIDEIDVHLHPSWQRRVGLWFRKHFPKIQFIVSTHSPLICQAADVGSVFLLPRPGSDDVGGMLRGTRLKRLLYGNVLDAYSTEVFGRDVTRSDKAKEKRRRLAQLNVKELRQGLTEAERREQEELRGAMPTAALSLEPIDDPDS